MQAGVRSRRRAGVASRTGRTFRTELHRSSLMTAPPEPSCRTYVILAREGRSAVVFRRGPTRQVLVLRWWLDDDRIEPGQWLKGRIYERRCDLSPNGDLLIYFAAKWESPLQTWTAVSRTPYLTALALWPKGDAWGGGGVFESPLTIGLNHRTEDVPQLPQMRGPRWHPLGSEKHALPKNYKYRRWSEHAGYGEDNPIEDHRITRDGWTCTVAGEQTQSGTDGYFIRMKTPEIYERPAPKDGLVLRRMLKGIGQKGGPWYDEDFAILRKDGTLLRQIPECGWADWQSNGDLLIAREGCLYRLKASLAGEESSQPLDGATQVADLAPLRFKGVEAPEWALKWP